MLNLLRDKIAKYVTKYSDILNWENTREMYGMYSYLMFLSIACNSIEPIESLKDIVKVAEKYELENAEVLTEIIKIINGDEFVKEIVDIFKYRQDIDLPQLYQEYLTMDFVVKDDALVFEGGKNSRDVLGSYYTQEEFAETITKKAIEDFELMNSGMLDKKIEIVDYSCGGSAFLMAAYRLCKRKRVCAEIIGYDVDPIAVIISRYIAVKKCRESTIKIIIYLGNPLLPCTKSEFMQKFRCAILGRYYNANMGINLGEKHDIVIGNPPWEKIRFEEKKFLHHFFPNNEVSTKTERSILLNRVSNENRLFFNALSDDYETSKIFLKKSAFFENSNCGELNTYALFTELSYRMVKKHGIVGLIIKSSLVKMPVYSRFFRKITYDGDLYDLFMFVNREKIFTIDSREEFAVIYLSQGIKTNLKVALDLDEFKNFDKNSKLVLSYQDLNILNPETGMIPNIKNNSELQFLIDMAHSNEVFGNVYKDCLYGRLVHLTNHTNVIRKEYIEGYKAIYEGKFIEQYTNKYATFNGMNSEEKYKNKASARQIENPQGIDYPEARFFIDEDAWTNISKNFHENYVIAWRSLTSATNRRTMIATILPLIPTCQSIQLLQLKDERQMLHILALFNSIVFDYMVRLKMAGLDLTQTIIKQIPVPEIKKYDISIEYKGVTASISEHIISRLRQLYSDDKNIKGIFEKYITYEVNEERKVIFSDIDKIIAKIYGLNDKTLRQIAIEFNKFYPKEEVENLF